jgi:hypothetical protein
VLHGPDLIPDMVPDPVPDMVPDRVPDMVPDRVPVMVPGPGNKALQNDAVRNTDLTKVAIANSVLQYGTGIKKSSGVAIAKRGD